jgi:hypothetical protein
MWFKIYGGVHDTYHGIYEYDNEEDALEDAYQLAIENYESYEGLHGIPSWNDCKEDLIEAYGEDEITDEDVDLHYIEARESWITYHVKEVSGPDAEEED